jgi:hypothetical protein
MKVAEPSIRDACMRLCAMRCDKSANLLQEDMVAGVRGLLAFLLASANAGDGLPNGCRRLAAPHQPRRSLSQAAERARCQSAAAP